MIGREILLKKIEAHPDRVNKFRMFRALVRINPNKYKIEFDQSRMCYIMLERYCDCWIFLDTTKGEHEDD